VNHAKSGRATDFFNSLLGRLVSTETSAVGVAREATGEGLAFPEAPDVIVAQGGE